MYCQIICRRCLFRDQDYFLAGELHHHYDTLEHILEGFDKRVEILGYIKNGVSVFDFFSHFKRDSKGKSYDSPLPPPIFLEYNKVCDQHVNLSVNLSSREFAMTLCPSGIGRANVTPILSYAVNHRAFETWVMP